MDERRSEKIADSLVLLIRIFRIMKSYGEGVKPAPFDPIYGTLSRVFNEDLTMSELGLALQRSRPNMTAIVGRLIGEGMAKRLPDKTDRRIIRIGITPRGKRFVEKRRMAVKESIKENLARLDDQELDRFCRALEDVNKIADKISRDRYERP